MDRSYTKKDTLLMEGKLEGVRRVGGPTLGMSTDVKRRISYAEDGEKLADTCQLTDPIK